MTAVSRLDDFRDIPADPPPPTPEHSWRPLNLIQLAANPPEPPSIGGLLYPGKRTVLSGETESMKTWLALILAKAELDIEQPVCWVDLDAMGPGAMLQRLELLGVPRPTIAHHFHYIEPSETLDPAKITDLQQLVDHHGIRLFVIDAFNPILNLHGLDPNSVTDVETFWRTIADPIAQAGAAPVLLDHVVKNPDNRGKYASGSERKASGAIVHLGFKLLEPLRQGAVGRSLLNVHKDRPGYLPRPSIGRLVLDATGATVTYRIEVDHSLVGDKPRHTIYMERVSRHLETYDEPTSKANIEKNVDGNGSYIRKAIDELKEDGYVTESSGPRGAKLITLIRPFREAYAPQPSTSSRPRPDLVPDLTSRPPRHLVPPYGDEDEVRRRPADEDDLVPNVEEGDPIPEYEHPPITDADIPWDLLEKDEHGDPTP